MKEIKVIRQAFMLDRVLDELKDRVDLPGITISKVLGWGKSRAQGVRGTELQGCHSFVKKTRIEIVVTDEMTEPIVDVIAQAARREGPSMAMVPQSGSSTSPAFDRSQREAENRRPAEAASQITRIGGFHVFRNRVYNFLWS